MPLASRSPAAEVIADLQTNPLGTLQGEAELQTPFNVATKRPNVYIVNWSRTKERRICVVSVSSIGNGAAEALSKSHEYKKAYGSVELIREEAKRRDMSLYEDKIVPCVFTFTIDGQKYYVPPAPEDDPNNPQPELVPDGVWDLHLGNFERMHPDPNAPANERHLNLQAKAAEEARLALLWSRKKNPVWRTVVDGVTEERNNPYGYLEFIRQTPVEAPRRLDKPFLTALELAE